MGLLPTPFRVWAAPMVPIINAWMRQLDRSYIKFGEGKGSEDAAYRVALAAEARHE